MDALAQVEKQAKTQVYKRELKAGKYSNVSVTQFSPWKREWQATPVFLPGEFHGQRSLTGYSPWDCRVGHEIGRAHV